MDVDLRVDLDEVEQATDALADQVGDPRRALLRAGGVIRARARRIFAAEGPGWAPLAESTLKRKLTEPQLNLLRDTGRGKTGERSVVQRIVRDAAGAEKWTHRATAIGERLAKARLKGRTTAALEGKYNAALVQQRTYIDKIRKHRFSAVAAGIRPSELVAFARREVHRQKAHGKILRAFRQLKRAGAQFAPEEQRRMLRQGARRYRASEDSTRILGGLANTLGLHLVGPMTVRAYSKAYISGIHNDGGTAGHGAQIKARPFLQLLESDSEALAAFLLEDAMEAWERGEA